MCYFISSVTSELAYNIELEHNMLYINIIADIGSRIYVRPDNNQTINYTLRETCRIRYSDFLPECSASPKAWSIAKPIKGNNCYAS